MGTEVGKCFKTGGVSGRSGEEMANDQGDSKSKVLSKTLGVAVFVANRGRFFVCGGY